MVQTTTVIKLPAALLRSAVYSSNGKQILVGTDKTATLWNAPMRENSQLQGPPGVYSVVFSQTESRADREGSVEHRYQAGCGMYTGSIVHTFLTVMQPSP